MGDSSDVVFGAVLEVTLEVVLGGAVGGCVGFDIGVPLEAVLGGGVGGGIGGCIWWGRGSGMGCTRDILRRLGPYGLFCFYKLRFQLQSQNCQWLHILTEGSNFVMPFVLQVADKRAHYVRRSDKSQKRCQRCDAPLKVKLMSRDTGECTVEIFLLCDGRSWGNPAQLLPLETDCSSADVGFSPILI